MRLPFVLLDSTIALRLMLHLSFLYIPLLGWTYALHFLFPPDFLIIPATSSSEKCSLVSGFSGLSQQVSSLRPSLEHNVHSVVAATLYSRPSSDCIDFASLMKLLLKSSQFSYFSENFLMPSLTGAIFEITIVAKRPSMDRISSSTVLKNRSFSTSATSRKISLEISSRAAP